MAKAGRTDSDEQLIERIRRNDVKAIETLAKREMSGDESAAPMTQEMLKACQGLTEAIGNLAVQAEESWIKRAVGDDVVRREATRRKLDELKRELAGPRPTPLERLLADRIVACWYQVQYADATYASRMHTMTWKSGTYCQQSQDRAHQRLLSAIKTLAVVRRLAIPPMQVNIGDKQVNVAASGSKD